MPPWVTAVCRYIPLVGPITDAPGGSIFRGTIDTLVTCATATVPIWLGALLFPIVRMSLPTAPDQWVNLKHGELFVASTALLAPILARVVRNEVPQATKVLAINVASLLVLLISTAFYFALSTEPNNYANPYVVKWSLGIFALASLALFSFAAQTAAPAFKNPGVAQREDESRLQNSLEELRREEP